MNLQDNLTFTLGLRSHKTLPSTIYIMWSMHLKSLKLLWPDAFTRKYFIWPLTFNLESMYLLHHATYVPAKFEVATSNGLEEYAFTRKFDFLLGANVTQNVTQYYLKSCDLCNCKVWSCYDLRFKRRCIFEKIHYLTFDLHKALPNTLYIVWPMHLQNLKLVCPTV